MQSEIRFIPAEKITGAVKELCIKANTCIGGDILGALEKARSVETSPLALCVLETLLENAKIAEREKIPVCQDTGMAVVFISLGRDVHIEGNIDEAVNEGVRQGYREGYCRSSVVRDPIKRENTTDNTPAVIYYDFIDDDSAAASRQVRITVAPKGFGSENMSAVRMLNPSSGIAGVEEFIVETIKTAGANSCPPVIAGVGLGGTMEKAALLAKKALLREAGSVHPDPFWAEVEAHALGRINALGIGPAGFGGKTTALGVHIISCPTHIAGLPAAVNIGCHATRHGTVVL